MPDLTGMTLGKHRLLERLGRGGMAEVYRAYQPNLERDVAVKVMHSYMAEDPGFIGRFKREAKAVAALRHPNIIQVYDFDVEGDDVYYMVMEYIGGETLKARLERLNTEGRRLPLREVERVFLALCDAMDYAHGQGRMHRDIKPANIMFDGDRLVLTDFGIATIVGGTCYTAPGTMVGTPAYMSPEQCQGEPGDMRSDVYSLGIVLYEMLTGQVPFDADTPIAIVLKHINDPLPMPRKIVPDLPPAMERIILKALAKSPEDRYQSAGELGNALRIALSEVDTTVEKAPFPLPTPVVEAAPETIPEALPARRRIPWIPIAAAAAAVAALIVVGVLFLPRLLGRGGPATPVAIVPTSPPSTATPEPPAVPPEAMASFQAGVQAYDMYEYEDAIQHLTEAIEAAPGFALAYHMRGVAHRDAGLLEEAEADLTQAITLQPDLAAAYYDRGYLRFFMLDRVQGAMVDFSRAIELDPEYAEAYLGRAYVSYWALNDFEEALADTERALAAQPDLVEALYLRGDIHFTWGEYDEAAVDFRRIIEVTPEDAYAFYMLGLVYHMDGDYGEAVAHYDEGLALHPSELDLYYGRALALRELGDLEAALEDLEQVLLTAPGHSGAHYARGRVLVDAGRHEEAIAEFTAAMEDEYQGYIWPFFLNDNPYLDRAKAYYSVGMSVEAMADLDTLIEEEPYLHEPYYYRGLLYKDLGQKEEAIADFETLWQLAPDDEWRRMAEQEIEALQEQ